MDQPVPNECLTFSEDGPQSGGTDDTGGGHRGERSDTGDDYRDEDGGHCVAYRLRGAELPRPVIPFMMEKREGGNYGEDLRPMQQAQYGRPNGEMFFVILRGPKCITPHPLEKCQCFISFQLLVQNSNIPHKI